MPPAVAVCSEAFFAIARKGIAGTFPHAIPLYNIGVGVSSVAAIFLLDGGLQKAGGDSMTNVELFTLD
jgi:hypothetical protein